MKFFKFIAVVLLLNLPFIESVQAATKVELKNPDFTVSYNPGSGDQIASGQLIGNSLILSSTVESKELGYSTVIVTSYALDGTKQWELPLTGEAISGPQTRDKLGNIYLLGAGVQSATTEAAPIVSSDPATLNPDNVQIEPIKSPVNSIKALIIWKISSTGQLVQSYSLPLNEVVSPKSITTTSTGLTITAATAKKYLQVTIDQNGSFGVPVQIKAPKNLDMSGEFKSGTNKIKFFISSKSIFGIPSWKPKKPTPVLVQYSKFGAIKRANYFLGTPIFLLFRADVGVILGTESTSGFGISIVKPLN